MELTKNYIPSEIEDKWYKHWLNKGYFNSTPDDRPAFSVVIPPPNVTGVLHMGHTLNETVQDILVRKARMSGFNACWVPGTDHASIATESKVVSMLKERGIDKNTLSREKFLVPYLTFATPLAIWLLVGYFRQLPPELEEAAMLDGASRMRTLVEIVAPLAAPGLATTGILTFLYCWNEFLFALSFTLGPDRYTVPVAIALFRGQYQVPWGQIVAAAVVATAPVVAVVLIFQRRIVSGLTSGALKG